MGPLVAIDDRGTPLVVTAPKERATLAVLALRAGRVVSAAELMAALWGEGPPRSAPKTVQAYVSALRRALPAGAIETAPGGYRLCLRADQVDAMRFESLARQGGQALDRGDYGQAVAWLQEGLSLWRGEPCPS